MSPSPCPGRLPGSWSCPLFWATGERRTPTACFGTFGSTVCALFSDAADHCQNQGIQKCESLTRSECVCGIAHSCDERFRAHLPRPSRPGRRAASASRRSASAIAEARVPVCRRSESLAQRRRTFALCASCTFAPAGTSPNRVSSPPPVPDLLRVHGERLLLKTENLDLHG
jgi:hypothetical protein